MSNGTPLLDAWFDSARYRDKFGDMSADEIERLSFEQYAKITGRATPAEAALQALSEPPDIPITVSGPPAGPTAPQAPEDRPQGADISQLSMSEYAAYREQLGVGGHEYGNGILGAHGSWADAARAKAGRSAMAGNRNTIEPPRIERYVRQDDRVDHRSAADRLSNAANMWRGR
jgi:hypothetical protein